MKTSHALFLGIVHSNDILLSHNFDDLLDLENHLYTDDSASI